MLSAYLLAGWIGSSVAAGDALPAPAPNAEAVTIMVETNGVHTSIVVPVVSPGRDWREVFPSAAETLPNGEVPTHLSIGWGEREVFLHVPTWADLSPATALRVATVGGESMLRVSHYYYPAASVHHRPLRISPAQFARIVVAIDRRLPPVPPGETRASYRGTYADDAYYEALGTYTLVTTCNTWVGETLTDAGVAMGWWTPFAGGVMKWIPRPPKPA